MKGATGLRVRVATQRKVSIHAPVKGATGDLLFGYVLSVVSIHAPVKGATVLVFKWNETQVFQSTRP